MALVVDGDEKAARPAINHAKLLAGQADSRRVDDWHHLLDVLAQQAEKQSLVSLLKVIGVLIRGRVAAAAAAATTNDVFT